MHHANHESVPDQGASAGILAYLFIAAVVLLLMMVLGLLLRMEQGQIAAMGPLWFYKIMTAHGMGMVGVVGLAGGAIMWHFLRQYVALSTGVLWLNLTTFVAGVLLILGSVFLGNFHAAWTFLRPLPALSISTG